MNYHINLVISVLEISYFQKVSSDFEEDEILSQLFEGNRKGTRMARHWD